MKSAQNGLPAGTQKSSKIDEKLREVLSKPTFSGTRVRSVQLGTPRVPDERGLVPQMLPKCPKCDVKSIKTRLNITKQNNTKATNRGDDVFITSPSQMQWFCNPLSHFRAAGTREAHSIYGKIAKNMFFLELSWEVGNSLKILLRDVGVFPDRLNLIMIFFFNFFLSISTSSADYIPNQLIIFPIS